MSGISEAKDGRSRVRGSDDDIRVSGVDGDHCPTADGLTGKACDQ